MKIILLSLVTLFSIANATAQRKDARLFELRTYFVHPGQMDALLQQFEQQTNRLFKKRGIEQVGRFYVPASNSGNVLYYILAFPNAAEREKRWKNFDDDSERKKTVAQTKTPLVDSMTTVLMNGADILPSMNFADSKSVLELRTYTCYSGRLPNLISRFKDHTLALFKKHGMESVAYFTTAETNGNQPKLVYLLGHHDVESAAQSWAAFRADQAWITAKEASEKDGKIVEKVESVFLKTTESQH